MKKKKSLCLSAIGVITSTSATVAGVLLTKTNNNFDVNTKTKSIEDKKSPLLKEELINYKENLLLEIEDNIPNDAIKKTEISVKDETKKTIVKQNLNEEHNVEIGINDNNQEDEFITVENEQEQLPQPNKIIIDEDTESETTSKKEVNSELNIDIIQPNLNNLSFENKNKTKGFEIQSLATIEDFKAKIFDKIKKQRGFSTLQAHHIEIMWNDGTQIVEDFFPKQKTVFTSWITIKATNVEGSPFRGKKDIQFHWLNEEFTWDSLLRLI